MHARELELGPLVVLERQSHLEQRRVGGLTLGREVLDQTLERHLRVCEGGDVGGAGPGEQFAERLTGPDLGTQHECVDEHAHEVVEFGLAAPGDRGSDGDVVRGARSCEQHGQRRVTDHEHRGVMARCHAREPLAQFGIERELVRRTGGRLHRRPRTVDR